MQGGIPQPSTQPTEKRHLVPFGCARTPQVRSDSRRHYLRKPGGRYYIKLSSGRNAHTRNPMVQRR